MTLAQVRSPAVAGTFYPGTRRELEGAVRSYLGQTRPEEGDAPKALIAPHAGYVYSGPIAASAYALLAPVRERIERVVLLGPAHRVFVRGLALPDAPAFATPLGEGDACDDGSLCTAATCQSGACVEAPDPATSCSVPTSPGKSRLLIKDQPGNGDVLAGLLMKAVQ